MRFRENFFSPVIIVTSWAQAQIHIHKDNACIHIHSNILFANDRPQ